MTSLGSVHGLRADLTVDGAGKGKERVNRVGEKYPAEEDSTPLEMRFRRIPTPNGSSHKVTVFNGARGSSIRIFEVVDLSKQQKIDDAFHILKAEVLEKLIGADDDNALVTFDLSQMTVRCKQGGAILDEDLKKLVEENPACMEAFKVLEDLICPLWGGSLGNQWVQTGRKASSVALQAMKRTGHETLEKLPNTYSDCAKVALELYTTKKKADAAQQDEALKRIAMVERIIDSQMKIVQRHLDAEQEKLDKAVLANPAVNQKPYNDRMEPLKALKAMLTVDRLGLYVAAAFTPPYNPQRSPDDALAAIQQAAGDAQEMLQKHIDEKIDTMRKEGVRRTWPKWMRGQEKPIPENKTYSVDAAALIFSSLPVPLARQANYFCHQHSVLPKRECLGDELIRFITDARTPIPLLEQAIAKVSDIAISAELANDLAASKTANYPPPSFPAQGDINAKIDSLKTAYSFTA